MTGWRIIAGRLLYLTESHNVFKNIIKSAETDMISELKSLFIILIAAENPAHIIIIYENFFNARLKISDISFISLKTTETAVAAQKNAI